MHLYRISFATGLAIGFVIGTRAGRERYDQMVKFAKAAAENPTVQQAAGAIQAQVSTAAQKVGGQLHDRVPQMAQSAVQSVGGHISGVRHKDGQRGAPASGGTGADSGRPFAATSSNDRRPSSR